MTKLGYLETRNSLEVVNIDKHFALKKLSFLCLFLSIRWCTGFVREASTRWCRPVSEKRG